MSHVNPQTARHAKNPDLPESFGQNAPLNFRTTFNLEGSNDELKSPAKIQKILEALPNGQVFHLILKPPT